jgi:hypothetical protein
MDDVRTPSEIIEDVVALVAGLQVPVSLMGAKVALGTGHEAWQRLRDDMTRGRAGWMTTDLTKYNDKLTELLECPLEHDYSGEVQFET